MAVYRMQCAWQVGSTAPRDRMIINPVFHDQGVASDPESLTEDLATALNAWAANPNELVVKCYDALDPPPNVPLATVKKSANSVGESLFPREIALCLSFYSTFNQPRRRGRVYVPAHLLFTGSALGARPPGALQEKVMALGPIFSDLGGADVDWSILSTVDNVTRKVTNYWCDDEWDTVRKRGLRATSRLSATSGE